MSEMNIDAEWIDDDDSVIGHGISIRVNSRTFIIAVGVIKNE